MSRQLPRRLSSQPKWKRARGPSIPPALKKPRFIARSRGYLNPDEPIPSIEMNSDSQGHIPLKEDNFLSSPIFIDKGVLVGFWCDASRTGRRRVYCLVDKAFEFAYQEGKEFILVREIDFTPLRGFGDWQGDDSEAKMKKWVRITWNRRDYLGKHMTLTDLTLHVRRESKLSKAW